MTIRLLLRKLRIENKEFITSEELKEYCKAARVSYVSAVGYFIKKKYVVRIFRGIFYLKSLDEIKLGRSKYSYLELVSKGLEIKKIKNWYFGLHTALKLNNITHEHFSVEEVINDTLLRSRPMKIAGYEFRFVKLSPKLLSFGVSEKDEIRYSDPEKTLLDFVYLWRYNGVPAEKIDADISEWSAGASKSKLRDYARKYPATVSAIVQLVVK
jgi:predicted transcriptional regulator of viral defense system